MKIIDFSEKNSLINSFTAEMRDANIQKDPGRFRKNMQRLGEIMAYEISGTFEYRQEEVHTPFGVSKINLPAGNPVISTILRAGIPFHYGFLSYFDHAENAFVSAYRKYKDALKFDVNIEYITSPRLDGKTLIITDPMLATGVSMELAYKALLTKGTPACIHVASIIASQQAVEYVKTKFPENTTFWFCAVDPDLSPEAYIMPGLGDAGDLAFGEKE
ncbi:MAG: uracil phosphoribosyltransferase [Candidatus Azobacteroides sp.]|nr:uracil phosphoribosyltransferase [Candidatus Azobacteroides sp.]